MRLSFVDPRLIQIAREALMQHGDWDALFSPEFEAPPAPDGVPSTQWPQIAEHVARAERVSGVVRSQGLEASQERFGDSTHAIEVATVVAAANQVGEVTFELLRSLLSCRVDELVAYGNFIAMLSEVDADPDDVIALYEQFCAAVTRTHSDQPGWAERVDSVQDGLATVYVQAGRLDDAHQLFATRHQRSPDLTAALAASRSFLASGHLARAMQWLELGAERADAIDRPMMAFRLRKKCEALRQRTC